MKITKSFTILMILSLSLWVSVCSYAQETVPETNIPAVNTAADMTEGEIRKIDKANNKITIKHGEIRNLDMPGMTMVFQVKDPALLDTVKSGDKVKFRVEKAGGALVIIDIQAVR